MDENYLDNILNSSSNNKNKQNNEGNSIDSDIDLLNIDNISLDGLGDLGDLDDVDLDNIDLSDLDELMKEDTVPNQKSLFEADELEEEASDIGETISNTDDMVSDEETPVDEALLDDASVDEALVDGASVDGASVDGASVDDVSGMDLDDIFQALGIEDKPGDEEAYTSEQGEPDDMLAASLDTGLGVDELDDIEDISKIKPKEKTKIKNNKSSEKKTLSQILFGEPDEDDLEEEKYFAERKIKKEEEKEKKKARKQELNEERKAKKEEKAELKRTQVLQKKKQKQEKEKKLNIELEQENQNEKKVSNSTVAIVFAVFVIFAAFVLFGTREFNYAHVVKKANDYFGRQRYRLAYDEVSGVEIKKKDEELRDRIYTVMYVERLYESYENNMQLGRPDKALDALVRGVQKYDEHYEEAVSLQIVGDINICKEKIINALWNTYKMTEDDAYIIMQLEGQAYSDALKNRCDNLNLGEIENGFNN